MNLKNLASLLGMSKTTVSRALNGYPEVNGRTRERVLAAARETGYEANPMARSLAVGRSNMVGIIDVLAATPGADADGALCPALLGGLTAALESASMSLVVAPVTPANEQAAYQRLVRGRLIDALVLAAPRVEDSRLAYLVQAGFPLLMLGQPLQPAAHAWFDYDHRAGIGLAVARLLALGHRRLALLSAPLASSQAWQCRAAFLEALQGAGLGAAAEHLLDGLQGREDGYRAMRQLLAGGAPRPSAVIVDRRQAGEGALRALLDAGLTPGREVSVVVAGRVSPLALGLAVSAIEQPEPQRAGARVAEMVLALLAGSPAAQLQELWPARLLDGATAGPAPG